MDMLDHLSATSLRSIYGGSDLSGSLVRAISTIISSALEIGRSLGSAIRRISFGDIC